ncbi:DNA repair protein RadC [Desulfarculus baarsii DSM 2075]|uniref:DNA repair protein RadC n=1 Tax=Desulfarculus baarsii (strain ATCC 33931 / DSM 2075 / LMG 7858 / VKM B-1802 / 2st14) TaxID=644282 RepID=E1QKP1_DESB2|nr:DNA repair protein RadC [Desulfarculus baarsii]ADK86250.1 DNA repair protein RadC [Desulfarculus baarsii DSM 2075]
MSASEHPGAGHRQRLRDKFLAHGLAKFTDEEALELLLTLATPRQDCKQQARTLLGELGGLQAVLDAPAERLAQVKGVGPKNVLGLKLVPAVARRYLEDKLLRGEAFLAAEQAAEYLRMGMQSLEREVFRVMLLDGRRRLIAIEDVFSGTIDRAVVYPREVAALALARGATALACAHNHPSGDATPSTDDRAITRRLYYACQGVGLELVDHIIVAGRQLHSFAQSGFLAGVAAEYQALDLEG